MSEQEPFARILDLYISAVRAKDVDAFLAIYDDDVHVFDKRTGIRSVLGAWTFRVPNMVRRMQTIFWSFEPAVMHFELYSE